MNAEVDISKVVIMTERLTLRPWEQKDLMDLYEYASVDGVGQMAGWLPHQYIEESQTILDKFIEGKREFALEYKGKAIGSLGIGRYKEENLPEYDDQFGVEIGYVLSKDYWGRGLMPEAVKAVCMYLFDNLKLDFIVCGHFLDNLQSMRVQEKCGFEHRKLVKYETQYGIVKNCWLSVLERKK